VVQELQIGGTRSVPAARAERAPAKVNLTLHVLGRRADGYHELESLVVFAGVGDTLTFTPGRTLVLDVRGPTAAAAGDVTGNLVLSAAQALAERVNGLKLGRFVLTKFLPVAAGLGGGSADAAAALRLLARTNKIGIDDPRLMAAARATGADVPVCLDPRSRMMRGIGEVLSAPLDLPGLPAVLVNPGVAVPTKDVFAALHRRPQAKRASNGLAFDSFIKPSKADLIDALAGAGNDLEAPAIAIKPVIADVLRRLRRLDGCRLARMSGSGATCFGLFDSKRAATAAARVLREQKPRWWVRGTELG
jgi:4-diphosphocytidyl-2-C-methyl-D-erythritol kinase